MQTKFKIQKGVKIPSAYRSTKYPFPDMEIGDSFVIPKEIAPIVRVAANDWRTFYDRDKKFSVKRFSDTEHRCWRVN